jgi:hypothetical protein
MWVWRDVLGEEPRIYAQKIRDRAEVETPEPQGCMAFIVAVFAEINPVPPGDILALERQLHSLKPAIPEASLLR